MDHTNMAGMQLHSTFEGHVLPGSLFLLWAVVWMVQRLRQGGDTAPDRALESSLFVPVLKVVLPLVGVWVEIPGEGWGPTTTLMSLQHVTMYSAFSLTGVVDLLARRGLVSNASTYVAYAAAQTNAGFLFWGHAVHGGVDGIVHKLLAMAFFAVAGLAVAESIRPSGGLAWMRIGAQLVLGSWFILGAWILYLSGWDLAAPFNEGRSSMVFSWLVMAVTAVTLGTRILSGRAWGAVAATGRPAL